MEYKREWRREKGEIREHYKREKSERMEETKET